MGPNRFFWRLVDPVLLSAPFVSAWPSAAFSLAMASSSRALNVAVLYLAIKRVSERRTRPIKNWTDALNYFAIAFDGGIKL